LTEEKNTTDKRLTEEKNATDKRLTELRLASERFSKATEQLANDKLPARLGAIYSLENIAKEHEEYHWIVVEVLSAFIRDKKEGDRVTIDCQSALTIIGRRNINLDKDRIIDLSGANLREAIFDEDANFSKVRFNKADLRDAILDGVLLREAVIIKSDLSGIQMNEADLTGIRLEEVNLEKAILDNSFLTSATLNKVNFKKASLRFTFLDEAELTDIDFEGANLNKARFNGSLLTNIKFSGAELIKTNLSNAQLKNTDFINVNLTDANLIGTNLSSDNFYNSTLCRTTMHDGIVNNSGCGNHK